VSQDATEINALNEKLAAISREPFEHLRGKAITVTDGALKYGIHRTTIFKWIKQGFVHVLMPGYRMEVDEGDVAYCARVHDARKDLGGQGTPLLDEAGRPYLIKRPKLSEYRRRKKTPAK